MAGSVTIAGCPASVVKLGDTDVNELLKIRLTHFHEVFRIAISLVIEYHGNLLAIQSFRKEKRGTLQES